MYLVNVDLSIEDSTFTGLQERGNAVLSFVNSKVTILNSSFSGGANSAAGAVYANQSSQVTILDSMFLGNSGGQGGAVATWDSSILVNGSTFSGNLGGGLSIMNGTTVFLTDNTFEENSANNGGGVYVDVCGSAVLEGNSFQGNQVQHSGGGVFLVECNAQLSDNTFEKNRGTNGAAVWQNNCRQVLYTHNNLTANVASAGSGGLEINQGSANITQCTFTLGKGVKGGGVYMQGVTGTISDCVFERNAVSQFGGAVFRGTSKGDLYGCEFTGNTAVRSGAVIYDSHCVGDIGLNVFSNNKARGDNSVIFRTESQGNVKGDNKGLTANLVHVDNNGAANQDYGDPNSATGS
ncbi:hypothetical protein WJX73_004551 [Symbiochloris irregularis]|uniref:Right handed beta helix domain-containing protein n=1 Tax=Symbiochloris irregularis TaxID=706552 RepID=A0AAW1NYV2_9CHLO